MLTRIVARAALASCACVGIGCSALPSPAVPAKPAVAAPTRNVSVWIDEGYAESQWSIAEPRRVGSAPSGHAYVKGSFRFVANASQKELVWGSDRFASAIVTASQTSRGWSFVARDGAVARADSFEGPLERVGNIPDRVASGFAGDARSAVIARSGAAYVVDETLGVIKINLPGDPRVIVGAFISATRGALIAETGLLFATSDGGSTWRRVPTGKETPWELEISDGELLVTSTGSTRVLTEDDSLAPRGARRAVEVADEEVDVELDPAWVSLRQWARFPESARYEPGLLFTNDGRGMISDFGRISVFELETGQPEKDPIAPVPKDRTCNLSHWGEAAVVHCGEGEHAAFVLRAKQEKPLGAASDRSGTFSTVPDLAPPVRVAFSNDGVHAAWTEQCRAPDAGKSALCTYGGSGGTKALAFDVELHGIAGVRGAHALVYGSGTNDQDVYQIVDIDRGTRLPIERADLSIEDLGFASDETIVGIGRFRGGDPSPVLLRATLDGKIETRALPAGANDVGFLDRERGVAAGAFLPDLWFTNDGGRSWDRAPLNLTGAVSGVALPAPVACERDACLVGGVALVSWSAARTSEGKVITNDLAIAEPEDDTDDCYWGGECSDETPPRIDNPCAVEISPSKVADTLSKALAGPTPDVAEALGVGYRARLAIAPEEVTLEWRAAGSTGKVLRARSTSLDLPPSDAATLTLLAADARYVFLSRCVPPGSYRRTVDSVPRSASCVVLRGEAGKRLSVVTTLEDHAFPSNMQVEPQGILHAGGAATLLFARYAGIVDGRAWPDLDTVLAIDRHGRVARERSFAWRGDGTRRGGLGVVEGVGGYVASRSGRPDVLSFFGLAQEDEGVPFAVLDVSAPICESDPVESAKIGRVRRLLRPLGVHIGNMEESFSTLEVDGEEVCLRTFEGTMSGDQTILMRADEGKLSGGVTRPDGYFAAECKKP